MHMDPRFEEAAKIVKRVSENCASAYRRKDGKDYAVAEDQRLEDCAVACSNTGYFILSALGLSHKEIVDLETE